MHTTLQRCPRNSVEQLGQIEDASFFSFAGRRFAGKSVVSEALDTVVEADGFLVKCRVELIPDL